MKLDTRNPFAAWGFEEEKYAVNVAAGDDTVNELEGKGFINETVVDNAYNTVAEPISAASYSEQHTDQDSFFTNNENMLPTELQNKAYGENNELQREYPAGEPLNYYGNEADDLHLYGDPEPEPEPEVIKEFTSYAPDGETVYATGKVKVLSTEGTKTFVEVVENSIEGWVGNKYYIVSTEKVNDLYKLFDMNGNYLDILISVNE